MNIEPRLVMNKQLPCSLFMGREKRIALRRSDTCERYLLHVQTYMYLRGQAGDTRGA